MNDNQKQKFSDLMDAVMPVYRMETSTATKKLWWGLLVGYDLDDVAQGFAEHLKAVPPHNTITPAHVIQQIDRIRPDGRLGVEEAWSMVARDESATSVVTSEMMEALRFAQPLLNEGDSIGARMAFKEAYKHIVDDARRAGKKPQWFVSMGSDKNGRDAPIAEAVRLGRLGVEHAIGLIAPEQVHSMLEAAGESKLALEYKQPEAEEFRMRIEAAKLVLKYGNVVH
jgi:hypothetical protein